MNNAFAKLIAALALWALAIWVGYLTMVNAWGVQLKSLGWLIGGSMLSAVILIVLSFVAKSDD
jgi:hypothetical protein